MNVTGSGDIRLLRMYFSKHFCKKHAPGHLATVKQEIVWPSLDRRPISEVQLKVG